MRELCQHPTLRYQWIRYLPDPSGDHWDFFWKVLVEKIKDSICRQDVFFLRDSSLTTNLDHAMRLAPGQVDEDGNPLFADLLPPATSYISPDYINGDLNILVRFGLKNLPQKEFLARVKLDLSKPLTSKMMSYETNEDWHSRAARWLSLSFEHNCVDLISETKSLDLIPLDNKTWTSSMNGDVFFPDTTNGMPIPNDLNLQLVDPEAPIPQDRKLLFDHLGVKYASTEEIRAKIIQKYDDFASCSLEESMVHLR